MHDDSESVVYGDFNFEGMRDGEEVSELEVMGGGECVCKWMLRSRDNFLQSEN